MIRDKVKYIVDEFEGGNKSQFARKVGIPGGKPTLVGDWICGKSTPKAEYQRNIVQAYGHRGVTADWLVDDSVALSAPLTIPPPPAPSLPPPVSPPPSTDLSRILALWERDKEEARRDKDRLFAMVEEQQRINGAQSEAINTFARKIDQLPLFAERNSQMMCG